MRYVNRKETKETHWAQNKTKVEKSLQRHQKNDKVRGEEGLESGSLFCLFPFVETQKLHFFFQKKKNNEALCDRIPPSKPPSTSLSAVKKQRKKRRLHECQGKSTESQSCSCSQNSRQTMYECVFQCPCKCAPVTDRNLENACLVCNGSRKRPGQPQIHTW